MPDYSEKLTQYVQDLFAHDDDVLLAVRQALVDRDIPRITVRPDEGKLLQILAAASGARKIVEIGTLAGYSGIWLARALPADGKLYTLEKVPKHADTALEFFEKAGVRGKVDLRLGDALQSLEKLSSEGPFDMVFIDADKDRYPDYFAWALKNTRPGGLIAAHNAFRSGEIVNADNQHPDVETMRAFNQQWANTPNLLSTIIGIGDGTLIGVVQG